ncbi:hypothetical protein P175DRAFT_0434495 [Aspergillus ochraceoroseus IBT 24754]|nr:uncharacterized protein P175DRAFT_0434495 [Aspergillus ochraceoroseus IBT 24754]PTU21684.1 hypothetical protein P175DRAFT_0434495 [Aspergillus ochraceoroseus IBT 24754]
MHHPSTPGCSSNPNVFSDEYSLEPLDSEQSTLTPRSQSISSVASSHTLRSSLPLHPEPYSTTINDTNDELLENPFGDEARVSFDEEALHRSSLPQKGFDLAYRNSVTSNTTSASMTHRSQSSSSRFSIPPRALSPYTGATGPSHPYAMYPQVGVSRSPSVTTTSTLRPVDQPLGDSTAPQHPYAMYSQNVVVEEGMDNAAIPLGFPGHNQEAYHRALGRADDDVADLVGPDGHMEQLPPYSRYPDGASPKLEDSLDILPDAAIILDHPPDDHNQDLAMSEVSSRTLVADNQSQGRDSRGGGVAPVTGVMAFEEKLKRRGKKKVCCGLPIWTIVLISAVMVVGGSIGGAIGGILGARRAAQETNSNDDGPKIVTVTANPRTDATPISTTPYNVLPLPTGQWLIPTEPRNQSKFCIVDPDYTPSWACATQKSIPINVAGTDNARVIDFESDPLRKTLTYGAQLPFFSNPSQPLKLVLDSSDLSLGPALSFFTFFDKLVIVPEDTFPSTSVSKRAVSEEDIFISVHHRKRSTYVGDRPWFCWWNSTAMEFFLYLNETTKEARYSSFSNLVDASTTTSTDSSTATDSSQSTSTKRDTSLSNYPRRIKIEEKRDYAEAQSPYCQQMQVMDDGSIEIVSHETIGISVNEPTPTTTLKGVGSATQTYTAKAQYQSICYCVSLTD